MTILNTVKCEHCAESFSGLRADARYCSKRCRTLATKKRNRVRSGAFMAGESRQCIECGAAFMAIFDRHICCSDACTRAAHKKRTAVCLTRNCTVCEKEFVPNSSMHRLCSDVCLRTHKRHIRLAAMYGLTSKDFEEILRKQGGGCAICKTKGADRWAVDHNHECCSGIATCGKCVRGILCFPCNQALGLFKDSQQTVANALAYLTGSNEPGQPGSAYVGGIKGGQHGAE